MEDLRPEEPVLLIAYGCEPGRGSEPGIGWHHAVATARSRPTYIVAHPDHRGPLCDGIADWNRRGEGMPMRAVYVDAGGPSRRWANAGYAGFNVYYYLWQRAAARAAVDLHRRVGFAAVQHVSLTRWWMPSPGAALAARGVPFVWGPLGAGETMPWRFRRGIGMRGHVTELSRAAARETFMRDPALIRCARLTTVGVAEPDETADRMRSLGVRRVERAYSLPCDARRMDGVEPAEKSPKTFRVVSGGGLVYWKSFHLSVRAFARAFGGDPRCEYVHVCGGEQEGRVRREAERAGVGGRVRLLGEMPHREALRWVASADLYVLPTLRDTTGHIFEALAAGVPVLSVDRLSPGAVLDDSCGRRVPVRGDVESIVEEMATTMRRWRDDAGLRERLSAGAKLRAADLSADAFGRRVRELQAAAIAAKSPAAVEGRTASCGVRPIAATSRAISSA